MIALNHDANDGEQWGRKLIYSDQKHHSVTIALETTTFAGDANLPLMSLTSPTDAASWGWRDDQAAYENKKVLRMKKVQNNMVKIW